MLVAAMNRRPCGYHTDPKRSCKCSPVSIERYMVPQVVVKNLAEGFVHNWGRVQSAASGVLSKARGCGEIGRPCSHAETTRRTHPAGR